MTRKQRSLIVLGLLKMRNEKERLRKDAQECLGQMTIEDKAFFADMRSSVDRIDRELQEIDTTIAIVQALPVVD